MLAWKREKCNRVWRVSSLARESEESTRPRSERASPARAGAAFYDVDGTLIRTNIVHAFGWYARHQPTLTGSLVKTAATALSIPLFLAADKLSRKVFNKL